mmetsp:Transcript_13623/g.30037  ORF Transcript_13623/g.30037 Transcript_13623/m.30037 type:complete len:433 (-) Transcript_13623:87-1385(-)|eukprot:CAMPEP_0170600314 /NCGR_PEP_ID=MMETSP0224-20130122/17268_1 /TAXON_ID=285029 /ORGANISM="Togula jolla, Strain CCCM 725" /LENGTH=432 /DNA_ID=CAMNT_0010925031 /DNA_START=61 /DNA_END=1359 /DNA_ORIENTATION=+
MAGLAGLSAANPDLICTARRDAVRNTNMESLLAASRLRVPIFQRRYCWGPEQWNCLLADALAESGHRLGRLVVAELKPQGRSRLDVVLCDGQQRCTTVLLLLAAIRDVAAATPGAEGLASRLSSIICPESEHLELWLATGAAAAGDQGEDLPFLALSPTYFDRGSFFESLLPPAAAAEWAKRSLVAEGSSVPRAAKVHFLAKLQGMEAPRLSLLAENVLSFRWLCFPLDLGGKAVINGAVADGTDNLHIIFIRLAWREAMWEQPQRKAEAKAIQEADFVRTLLLGSFRSEEESIAMYRSYWLPVERAAIEAARKAGRSDDQVAFLEQLLHSFLDAQPESSQPKKPPPPTIPGMSPELLAKLNDREERSKPKKPPRLFARFSAWLQNVLLLGEETNKPEELLADIDRVAGRTASAMERLALFASSPTSVQDSR